MTELRHWYLVQSKPNQEIIAKDNLENQGYKVYLPLIPTKKKRNSRTIRVIAPMFPRYLFISLSEQIDDWGPIRSTIGVSSLVRFGMLAAKVPENLITSLRSKENEDGVHPIEKNDFEEGDSVRIAEGPFEGYEAIFSAKDDNERVIVLLKIAEKYAKLKIKTYCIEKLN